MKIGRNLYEFEVGGTTYRVNFSHTHMRPVPAPRGKKAKQGLVFDNQTMRWYEPIRIGSIKAQHVTTCLFGTREQISDNSSTMSAYVGVATCSVRDSYNQNVGMSKAFERCLSAFGIQFSVSKDAKGKRILQFGSNTDRERYGAFMQALFTGMHNRTEGYGSKAA